MKAVLLKENFKEGITVVEKINPKRLVLPILENILLSTEENFIKLSATDLETAVHYWVLGKIEKQGTTTIPVKLLSNLIKTIKAPKITLELNTGNLFIYGEEEKLNLRCQNPDDFPIIPKKQKENSFTVDIPSFCKGIAFVADTVSLSQNKPELTGIYFKVFHNEATLVSTDSFRLSEITIPIIKNTLTDKEYSFIVPVKILQEILTTFLDKNGQLEVSLSKNQIFFEYFNPETNHTQVLFLFIDSDYTKTVAKDKLTY